MLFKPELCQRILDGEKTETRRPVKVAELVPANVPNDKGEYETVYAVVGKWRAGKVKWRVGHTYSIQPGRGKLGVGPRIRITSIRREWLHDITLAGAKREGFSNRSEFFEMWDLLNPKSEPNPSVWVLRFKLIDGDGP
jgi:hypothetical protein